MRWMFIAPLLLAACKQPGSPPENPPPTVSEAEALAARQACTFTAGALPHDTLSTHTRTGDAIPIQHIVLVMQENRSFDHYFSKLSHGGVNVAASDVTNPDGAGSPVARYHETHYCVPDPHHSWNASHHQYNNGANDGFVTADSMDDTTAMGFYDETDLPFYYSLARTFAISDMHFSSLLGPTWPNRQYYLAASTRGIITNTLSPEKDANGVEYGNIFNLLTDHNVEWRVYHQSVPSAAMYPAVYDEQGRRFFPMEQYFSDVATGNLAAVTWVEGDFGLGGERNDEHAPGNIQKGQEVNATIIRALMDSPAWGQSAMFLTYDEHGGFYDHVPPPPACPPDAVEPNLTDTNAPGRFDRFGFRVPLIVVSPFARRGYVSHAVSDHTSVTRFLEARFSLPALTARDANADALMDMFDFDHPDTSVPTLDEPVVDEVEAQRCMQMFGQ